MKTTQQQLLELSKTRDLSSLGLRETARLLGVKNPQTIKYHLSKLREAGLMGYASTSSRVDRTKLGSAALISIPILGSANAGPATHFASGNVEGYLKISSNLLRSHSYKRLYALRVTGFSMNQASIDGKTIKDGDYVVVDSGYRNPRDGDCVIAVVDGLANIKKLHIDQENNQIVLLSESTEDYMPIFIHLEDQKEGLISGRVVQVINKPAA